MCFGLLIVGLSCLVYAAGLAYTSYDEHSGTCLKDISSFDKTGIPDCVPHWGFVLSFSLLFFAFLFQSLCCLTTTTCSSVLAVILLIPAIFASNYYLYDVYYDPLFEDLGH